VVHHVQVAVEVGAKAEAEAVAFVENEARIDRLEGGAFLPFQGDSSAGMAGRPPALRSQSHEQNKKDGPRYLWVSVTSATTRESPLRAGFTT
jgi:hypothetical protein